MLLSFTDCAKKGMPAGGPRDTIPPMILRSAPENFSTHFSNKEIEIRFDEYIKLNNVNQELIISPPMTHGPIITPLSASKTLRIRIEDTLKPNTTYLFNFGNSIEDNNEGNVLEHFKYVFSTGSYVDSLTLSGRVRDAELTKPKPGATVMLYEMNESYTDSIIYQEKPMYITTTRDTTGVFQFTNLKEGAYLLVAIEEKNRRYIFNPREDKIGFIAEPITIPTDSSFVLTLFKEAREYKLSRPSLIGKNHIVFGYEGDGGNMQIEPISETPSDFKYATYKDQAKDSIHYWYKPIFEADSLLFAVKNKGQVDTAHVRMRELYLDSLSFSPVNPGRLKLKDTFKIRANRPIVSVNSEKITVMSSDSIPIDGEIRLNQKDNQAEIWFEKKENETYKGLLLPGAMTDFFGKENDSINFTLKTRSESDYGTLTLNLENIDRFPIIVQLVDDNYKVEAEAYLEELQVVYFDEILPKRYFLRIIFDDNENRKWDSGSFLDRRDPERILYYPTKIDVRANWSLNETFRLGR